MGILLVMGFDNEDDKRVSPPTSTSCRVETSAIDIFRTTPDRRPSRHATTSAHVTAPGWAAAAQPAELFHDVAVSAPAMAAHRPLPLVAARLEELAGVEP